MADRPDDDPNKRDSYAKHFKKAATFGRDDWRYLAPAAMLPLLVGMGLSTPALFETQKPAADEDLYTGLFDTTRAYSYARSGSDSWFFLLIEDGRPQVYERMGDMGNRLMLVNDTNRAKEAINGVIRTMEARIAEVRDHPERVDPVAEMPSGTAACDYVSQPFSYSGNIERYKDGCPNIFLPGHAIVAHQQEELTYWRGALQTIEATPAQYGPEASEVLTLRQQSQIGYFADEAATPSLTLLGIWLAGAAGYAGVSFGNARRRKDGTGRKPA